MSSWHKKIYCRKCTYFYLSQIFISDYFIQKCSSNFSCPWSAFNRLVLLFLSLSLSTYKIVLCNGFGHLVYILIFFFYTHVFSFIKIKLKFAHNIKDLQCKNYYFMPTFDLSSKSSNNKFGLIFQKFLPKPTHIEGKK